MKVSVCVCFFIILRFFVKLLQGLHGLFGVFMLMIISSLQEQHWYCFGPYLAYSELRSTYNRRVTLKHRYKVAVAR